MSASKSFTASRKQTGISCYQAETATVIDVKMSEIEREKVKFLAIDHHHLAVIANQIPCGARYRHALFEQSHFQFAEMLFAPAVGEGDQRMDEDAPLGSLYQSSFDVSYVKAENQNFDAFLRFPDPFN